MSYPTLYSFDDLENHLTALAAGWGEVVRPLRSINVNWLREEKFVRDDFLKLNANDIANKVVSVLQTQIHNHPDYGLLAGRVFAANLHRNTPNDVADMAALLTASYTVTKDANAEELAAIKQDLLNDRFPETQPGMRAGALHPGLAKAVVYNTRKIESFLNRDRDFCYTFSAIEQLNRTYLLRKRGEVVETPQFMHLRLAMHLSRPLSTRKDCPVCFKRSVTVSYEGCNCMTCGVCTHTCREGNGKCYLIQTQKDDVLYDENIHAGYDRVSWKSVENIYTDLSEGVYTMASPMMYYGGTRTPTTASCYVLNCSDAIDDIFDLTNRAGILSTNAGGGLGISLDKIRSINSPVGNGGKSEGVMPVLAHIASASRLARQGELKRPGSVAVYMSDWNAEVLSFLQIRHPNRENADTNSLFLGLWVSDLFIKRVREKGTWMLLSPSQCPRLNDVYGEEFEQLYTIIEQDTSVSKTIIQAEQLALSIAQAQSATGMPYIVFKDTVNRRSNQKHLGLVPSSNLCAEIVEFYDERSEVAVCNLGTVSLPRFVTTNGSVDYKGIADAAGRVMHNINVAIDYADYLDHIPVLNRRGKTAETANQIRYSNRRHRPAGIGIQGLHNVFMLLNVEYESEEAALITRKVYEAVYFGVWRSSCDTAAALGRTYPTYEGSPMSRGLFQFDMIDGFDRTKDLSHDLFDWQLLFNDVKRYGAFNSLGTCQPPTCSTSTVMENVESMEPMMSNMYMKKTQKRQFQMINTLLVKRLEDIGLWTQTIKQCILANKGKLRDIDGIPKEVKNVFKTAWEMKSPNVLKTLKGALPFWDQSASLNLFIESPTQYQLVKYMQCTHRLGFKTGVYYTHSPSPLKSAKFGDTKKEEEPEACEHKEKCVLCSS